ncbi:hypothetical protein EB230_20855 [Mesorhizobium sp. NZP2234]|nr:hypothetical protein EB230_20855 [Mesorhizobium sp. NZP2234]
MPIASITDDTHGTAAIKWTGATGTYNYVIELENSAAANVVDMNSTLSRVLVTLSLAGITPDASGSLTDRAAITLTVANKGFLFLHAEIGVAFAFYRWTGTAWDGPFPVASSSSGGPVSSLTAGTGITIDATNPTVPVVSATGFAPPQGRLTLTSGTAITATDVSGATSVYYIPASGNVVPVWTGSSFFNKVFSELTLALDATSGHTGYHQSGKNFDLFVINDSGTMRLVSGPAWSSDTTRGTGVGTTELELKNGIWTNKNALAAARFGSASSSTLAVAANRATFVGSMRMTADGTTEDSVVKRFISNASNLAQRRLRRADPASPWTYSLATERQANGNTANKVEVLNCLAGRISDVMLMIAATNSTTTPALCVAGIGFDSITARNGAVQMNGLTYAVSSEAYRSIFAKFTGDCGLGYHYLSWLERGAGTADTQTWQNTPVFGLSGLTIG